MSVFTNAASSAPEQAAQYVDAVLKLLGDREPLIVLEQTPASLRATVDDLSPDALRRPEAPGKWSIRDVLQHLADAELVWSYRFRMVLAQDRPRLTGYDQDRWADRLGYADADPLAAIETFSILRRGNLWLLERASAADFERVAVHAERGEESVAHMVRLNAGHDLLHLAQIERIARARR